MTFFVPITKNGMFKLTKCGLSPEGFLYSTQCNRLWLKRIVAAVTGTCIFGDAATFIVFINKDCRVLFGDIFIVPFLASALAYLVAMCSPGWGNLVAFDWNDLPVGREFDLQIFEKSQIPTPCPAFPPPPLPPALH